MNAETKDLLKSIGANAVGTVLGAGIIALLVFFAGKINLVVLYWKEISLSLVLIFVVLTLTVWFRKLLRLEKQLSEFRAHPKISVDHFPKIKKLEQDTKAELAKKANSSDVVSKSAFKDLKRTVKELEVFMHGQKGQMGELIGLVELLKEDIADDSWRIESTLEGLEKVISGTTLKGDMITDIEEQLCRLDDKPKYNVLVKKVRKHYQD